MIHFEGIELCSYEKSFDWAITKPEKNECVFREVDKLNKNVYGMIKIPNGYSITLKCPNCYKKDICYQRSRKLISLRNFLFRTSQM